jgi:hypothetical protein
MGIDGQSVHAVLCGAKQGRARCHRQKGLEMSAFFIFLGVVILAYVLYRETRRFGLDPADPAHKLLAAGAEHGVHRFTGRVAGTTKGHSSWVSGSVGGMVINGSGSVGGTISSGTTVHDQFFLVDNDGKEMAVQINNADVAVRDGQVVSAVWAIKKGKDRGPFILFRNHTTNDSLWIRQRLIDLFHVVGPIVLLGLVALFIGFVGTSAALAVILFLATPFIFWGLTRVTHRRVKGLMGSGGAPLIEALNSVAANYTTQQPVMQPTIQPVASRSTLEVN